MYGCFNSTAVIFDKSTLVSNIENVFSYDWVEFHDGNDESAPLLGCGKKWCKFTPPVIISSENVLLIKFHSDVGYELSGFEFLYEAGEMIYLQYSMIVYFIIINYIRSKICFLSSCF